MNPLRYEQAEDAATAVDAVASSPNATFLGGGTNLVDLMKLGVERPDVLVDVRRLPHDRIEPLGDGVRIGAAVPNSELAADPTIRARHPMLAQAVLAGASPQLRNVATTGGNLLQRTRCVYFQDVSTPCNKREPGSGCSARAGYQRYHAILGGSEYCIATHPSDLAVALAAAGATVHTQGPNGSRSVPVTDLYRLPGREPNRETVLEHGELVTAVDVPELASPQGYHKVRDRASYAFALVSVAAAVELADGAVREARVALGGVAPAPWRARAAEDVLRGAPATEETFREAAAAELAAAEPLEGNAFKVPLAQRTLVHTLLELTEERR